MYYNKSFVYTQRLVSEALVRQWAPGATPDLGASSWSVQRIPYPPSVDDAMVQVVQQNFPTVLMLSFILSVIIMCKNIVYEKEKQLKVSTHLSFEQLKVSTHLSLAGARTLVRLVCWCGQGLFAGARDGQGFVLRLHNDQQFNVQGNLQSKMVAMVLFT